MSEVDEKTYQQLKTRWENVTQIRLHSPNPPSWADREEQQAWDAWVDWVEQNSLNGTPYDPRGPEDDEQVEWA